MIRRFSFLRLAKEMPHRKQVYYASLAYESNPETLRKYLKANRRELGIWFFSVIGLLLASDTRPFRFFTYWVDRCAYLIKFHLGPEMFMHESALANNMKNLQVDEETDKLAELFIKLDRIAAVDKLKKIFKVFPDEMTLVQFLQICKFYGFKEKDLKTEEILNDLLEYEKIMQGIKNGKEKWIDGKVKEKTELGRKTHDEFRKNLEAALRKKKDKVEKKLRKGKNERGKFVLKRITQELQEIRNFKLDG